MRFELESVRLDLPIIGHYPLRQTTGENQRNGHRMAAHIQEPFVSFMNSVRNDTLFQGAVNVFLANDAWLTPTLAVFESYTRISGNRRANYNELIARDGYQYQPESIKNAWEAYFNNSFIQNGNVSGLDELMAFYQRMTKFFFDAGVPLLNGTDAPVFSVSCRDLAHMKK